MRRGLGVLVALTLALAACSSPEDPAAAPPPSPTTTTIPNTPSPSGSPSGTPDRPQPTPVVRPRDFDPGRAMGVVRHLAGEIGPRHGTSPEFREAAGWVGGYFERLGYRVDRQVFDVPGGDSWGVDVPAGESVNVVATPTGLDPRRPHLVVGAHLDTVPLAPGAEDNGSGVGVMLAAAAAAAEARTRLPVVWVAFGAEEPRGDGDDDHHYGSRAYVAGLSGAERDAVRAMVSLDRVGVGATVPVGSAHESDPVQQALLAAARRTGAAANAGPLPAEQRPLVVRPRRATRRPARQHAVRRLPLRRGRAVRRRPRAARADRPDPAGLAGADRRPRVSSQCGASWTRSPSR